MKKLRTSMSAALAVAGLLSAGRAMAAEHVAYKVDAATTGNQAYSGALGLDFDVTSPINVYSLGVYDSGQDGLALPLVAYIYDRDNPANAITSISFAAGNTGTLVDGSRFLDLPCPLTLPAGFHGTIVADGYGATEMNGNVPGPARSTDDGGGALTFVGGGRYSPTAGVFPTIVDGGPTNRYAAGTFAFAPACAADADCSNATRPKCGGTGLCGKAAGAFFPACTGATAACNVATATCAACDGDLGAGAATKACAGPQAPACVAGACVECNATKACATAAKPSCSAAGACVVCGLDFGSAAAGDKCPTSQNPYCKADGSCGKCTTNQDCVSRPGAPFCSADGSCSASCAKDADCGDTISGKVCDDTTKACVNGCRGSASGNGCPAGQQCTSKDGNKGACAPIPADAGTSGGTSGSSGGTSGSSGGTTSSGGAAEDAGSSSSSGGTDDGGCAVSSSRESSTSSLLTAFLLGGLVFASTRKRRR